MQNITGIKKQCVNWQTVLKKKTRRKKFSCIISIFLLSQKLLPQHLQSHSRLLEMHIQIQPVGTAARGLTTEAKEGDILTFVCEFGQHQWQANSFLRSVNNKDNEDCLFETVSTK